MRPWNGILSGTKIGKGYKGEKDEGSGGMLPSVTLCLLELNAIVDVHT